VFLFLFLVDFWRVTVFHENAEAVHQNMRVMQLEHNTNVLLQELSDMHEHADMTRREHSVQLASVHSLQDEITHERKVTSQLRSALSAAENETREAHKEAEQLQELVSLMDSDMRTMISEKESKVGGVQSLLAEERERCGALVKCIAEHEKVLSKQNEAAKVPPLSFLFYFLSFIHHLPRQKMLKLLVFITKTKLLMNPT
jgi:chromosome segregation ATPase